MILELIVTGVCLGGKGNGCSQCLSAYYHHNVYLQEVVSNLENKGKYLIRDKEWIVYAATPIYAIVSGESASFLLRKDLTLSFNPRNSFLIITWSY